MLHRKLRPILRRPFQTAAGHYGTCVSQRGSAHLSLAELQHLGQAFPLRRRQVLLRLKLLLQLDGLVVGEAHLAALSLM